MTRDEYIKHHSKIDKKESKPLYNFSTRIKSIIFYRNNKNDTVSTEKIKLGLFRLSSLKYILMFDKSIKGFRIE